jgi:hypothetical protein
MTRPSTSLLSTDDEQNDLESCRIPLAAQRANLHPKNGNGLILLLLLLKEESNHINASSEAEGSC